MNRDTVPRKALIIDDDPDIIETVRVALETKGFQVAFARDGNQGLALAERDQPELIVLDMMMPKRSGFLVLEAVRQYCPVPPRIIMITGNEGSRHEDYARSLGVDAYMRKPFPIDTLLAEVERLFD